MNPIMNAEGSAGPSLGSSRDRLYQRAAVLLLFVGLALRVYYYIADLSIWFDESWLLVNLLEKNYLELLGPLKNACNGPPLFLWLERALYLCLGDHPLVWRLPAFVAGLAGLLLFFYVARRLLPPIGLPWAVGLFALSDRLLWHSVEIRPYAIDVCVAAAVLAAWLRTEDWRLEWRLVLFALAGPVCLLASYPAMFVCGGLWLALLWEVWRSGRMAAWALLAVCAAGLGVTAGWLTLGPVRAQQAGMLAAGYTWAEQMPNSSNLSMSLLWPLNASFEVTRYCLRPTGGFLIIVAALGAYWLARSGRRQILVLLLAPLAAAMAAACLNRYPCGGGRPMLFMTPAAALLVGAAVVPLLRWARGTGATGTWVRWVRYAALAAPLALALAPMAYTCERLFDPWPRPDSHAATTFVLAHRRSDDFIVPTVGEREYYYRGMESWCRPLPQPVECPPGARFWVTLNPALPGDEVLGKRIAAEGAWAVRQRKEFFHMTLLLVEKDSESEKRYQEPIPSK